MRKPLFNTTWIRLRELGSTPDAVAAAIGGTVAVNIASGAVRDLAAIRMSHALSAAGMVIPRIPHRTISGGDGRAYLFRVRDMAEFLARRFGEPDAQSQFVMGEDWNRRQGILLLRSPFSQEGGQVTLWNGSHGAGPVQLAQARESLLWELR